MRDDKLKPDSIPLHSISNKPPNSTRIVSSRNRSMKFSHQLLYNSVPEWSSGYLNYDALKAAIYKIEKHKVQTRGYRDYDSNELESQGLIASASSPTEEEFSLLLDQELSKISKFFQSKYSELKSAYENLVQEIDQIETAFETDSLDPEMLQERADDDNEDDDDDDYDEAPLERQPSYTNKRNAKHRLLDFSRLLSALQFASSKSSASRPSFTRRRASSATSQRPKLQHQSTLNGASDSNMMNDLATHDEASSPGHARSSRPSVPLDNIDMDMLRDFRCDIRVTFKLRLQLLYREFSQLSQFITLNYTGFRKIIKKFDKITDSSLLSTYMPDVVKRSHPFKSEDEELLANDINNIVTLYAHVVHDGDVEMSRSHLQTMLREHIVWERNTVWREMIGLTSKGWSSNQPHGQLMDRPVVQEDKKSTKISQNPLLSWATKEIIGFIIGVFVFFIFMNFSGFKTPEERNCMAILALCTVFWTLEVIPLFATSILVPFLVVTFRVIRDDTGSRVGPEEASKYIFSEMFTPRMMLLIGGFTLAAGLSKHNIDRILSIRVLNLASTRPSAVLLAYMSVACFASMWISNVAAPVLCFSLIQPILRTLPSGSNYAKALILGIALSSNIGGLSSPISSPQNLIALEYMHPEVSWASWFAIAIPVSILVILTIWMFLIWTYKWDSDTVINPPKLPKERFTTAQWIVTFTSIMTIVLWCIEHHIEGIVGDMGIIAIVPMVVFFAFGILRKVDWESYPWSIVMLAMGGIALGKAVESSGLLDDADEILHAWVKGLSLWPMVLVMSLCTVVIATFISHTIAAVLIVPVAAQVGEAMDDPRPRLLILTVAFVSSTAMGLPVSSFPNQTAISLENDLGVPYLTVSDFLKAGIPMSVASIAIVVTAGYLLMNLLGI